MQRLASRYLLGLCGAAVGCQSDPPLTDYPLDGITVFVGFDEPICGGTFDWIEARLRWLVTETGLPANEAPIRYYWTREDTSENCPPMSGGCADRGRIYSPLEVLSHEMVHAHLAQLGSPRPWLSEGMAELLQDERSSLSDGIPLPSALLEVSKPQQLDYNAAASFVRYLRDRFGMPALIELYAALDGVDARGTPDVFLAVLGVNWNDVQGGYLATYVPVPVGSINCDFPEVVPEAETWTVRVDSPCQDAATVGPFLGWYDSDIPYSKRYVTLEIAEAGVYTVAMTSSADVSVVLLDCDEPGEYNVWYDSTLDEAIEMAPGRKRLVIGADIADAAVGEVVLRLAPPTTPVTPKAPGPRRGLHRHSAGIFELTAGGPETRLVGDAYAHPHRVGPRRVRGD